MTKDEALEMAIEAMEKAEEVDWDLSSLHVLNILQAIQACKEALEQPAPKNCTPLDEYIAEMEKDPEIKQLLDIARKDVKKWSTQPAQEPVAWMEVKKDAGFKCIEVWQEPVSKNSIPLYTHPAPSWQGLSDDEIDVIANSHLEYDMDLSNMDDFARAIEQALKEKNHA